MKRFLRILDITVTAFLTLVIVGATYLAVSARRSPDTVPSVLGNKILTVLSGSMEPAIHTGDVILVRGLKSGETPAPGEIVTYRTGQKSTMLITHRVVEVQKTDGEVTGYVTKGDANSAADSLVLPLQIVGRYRGRIPYFGYVANFIRKPIGTVFVVILPGVILVGMELRRLWKIAAETEAASRGHGA